MTGGEGLLMAGAAVKPFRTFEEAFRYIRQFTNYERMIPLRYSRDAFDLQRVRDVLSALGSPQEAYPIVHVAGTKGKGSVCAMIASVLQQAGLRVGLFSKPHLVRLNERVSINGREIPDEDFTQVMNELLPHLEERRLAGRPLTFFDLITVLALKYFAQQKADVVVLETGLGGRLDSTNVVYPKVTVITNVDFDHTHILGNTLERIAREKAGIIKPGVPVISGVEIPEPARVIEEIAERKGAPLYAIRRDFRLQEDPKPGEGFAVETWKREYRGLRLPLLGAHQRANAAVALAALEALSDPLGINFTEEEIRQGLAYVRLRGRIEVLSKRPIVILDVAHNPSSLRALRETLQAHYPSRRKIFVIGMSKDKDLQGGLREILPAASGAIFTKIAHPRGAEPEKLLRIAHEAFPHLSAEVEPTVEEALKRAGRLLGPEDLLCITGSFYLAGEAALIFEESPQALKAFLDALP